MSVRIITDSACDMALSEAARSHVEILPLRTIFEDGEYRDGIDLNQQQFFEKLIETGEIPSTCQVSPAEYQEKFEAALDEGDQVLCLTLSGGLSGCYQSALLAYAMLDEQRKEHVFIVDSRNVTVGQLLLVRRAIELRDQGLSAAEIAQVIEAEKDHVRVIALLDTLEYLKKGGRISSAVALAGQLLSVKPVVEVADGHVELVGKARGSKNGNNLLTQFVEKHGIDFERPFSVAYSGLSDKLLSKYLNDSRHLYAQWQGDVPVCVIGSVIGTHVGPGAIAVAFFSSKN